MANRWANTDYPWNSYKGLYEGKDLNQYGIPEGTYRPDSVQNNNPPTIKDQSFLARNKPLATKGKPPEALPLGANGYTPASNFNDPKFTGMSAQNVAEQVSMGTGQSVQSTPQLMISPSGQYVQNSWTKAAANDPKSEPQIGEAWSLPKAATKNYKDKKYADSEFLAELKALQRELAAFRAKSNLNRSRAGTQYSVSNRQLREQKTRDLADLKDDFAARGIVLSGVYGDRLGEYNELWGQEKSTLDRQYKYSLEDIRNQFDDFVREVGIQKEQARLAAIRRRAQKLGKL